MMTAHVSGIRDIFALGFIRALRVRPIVGLYLCSLLLGLLQTWPLLAIAGSFGLNNTLLHTLARGGADTYIDLLLGQPASAGVTGIWTLALVPAGMIYALVYNFWSGGIIAGWLGSDRGGWAACRRFFWTFTALQFLLLVVALALGSVTVAVLGLQSVAIPVFAIVLLQLANSVGETARAHAVVHERRSPSAALGAALHLATRRPWSFLALTFGGLALHVALLGASILISQTLPPSPWGWVWQQAFLFAAITVKVLRLSWATILVQNVRSHPPDASDTV